MTRSQPWKSAAERRRRRKLDPGDNPARDCVDQQATMDPVLKLLLIVVAVGTHASRFGAAAGSKWP